MKWWMPVAGLPGVVLGAALGCCQAAGDERLALESKFDLHAVRPGPLVGNRLDFSVPSGHGATYNLVSIDVEKRTVATLAKGLGDFDVIAADERHVAIAAKSPAGTVIVFDRDGGKRTEWCCYLLNQTGAFSGDTLRLASGASIVTLDLKQDAAPPERITIGGDITVFWGDKVVAIDERSGQPGALTVFGSDLKALGSMPLPQPETRNGHCSPGPATLEGHILAYVSSCGKIVVVDLDKMQVTQTLPYFDPASFYRLALSGDLLFAAPTSPVGPVVAFDVVRGRPIATLALRTTQILAAGDRLIAIHPDYPIKQFNIEVFRIHRALLQDPDDAAAAVVARCDQAAQALKAGATVDEALGIIEAETPAPLLDRLDKLDAHGQAAAAFYARLMARSVDRIDDGAALLTALVVGTQDDAKLKRYRDAARTRLNIHDASPQAAAEISGAAEVTMGTGAAYGLAPKVLLADDRAYVWQYGDAGDGHCATVVFHDRATLAPQAVIPAAGCDDEFQDEVTDVAVGQTAVYIALQYRFEQEGRPDLVVVDKANPAILHRTDLEGGIWSLAATADGSLLVCQAELTGACALYDQTDLTAEPKPDTVTCRPDGASFPGVAGDPALLALAQSGDTIVACNDRLVMTSIGSFGDAKVRLASIDAPDKPLAEVVTGGGWPEVRLGGAGASSFVATRDGDRTVLKSIAADSGRVRTEIAVRWVVGSNEPTHWTVDGDWVFIGRGADLIVYDVKSGSSRAFIKNFIAPSQDGRNHSIAQMIVDPKYHRLIALTADGVHSRIAPLDALKRAGHDWRAADAILAQD